MTTASSGEPAVEVRVTERDTRATAAAVPDFPWVRLHTGLVAYEEALIEGQYLLVNWSAMVWWAGEPQGPQDGG